MNEYEEIRTEIDIYLMEQFKYRLSLVYLTLMHDNIIVSRRNSRVDLYLRIQRIESLFPSHYLIIARICFQKERIQHGYHFVYFLTEIQIKYGFKYIGIESTNKKSASFAKEFGFCSIDSSNYTTTVNNLTDYFRQKFYLQ